MKKRARIVVDCCGDIRRITSPVKASFPRQREGIFKKYTCSTYLGAGSFGILHNLNER